MIASITFVSFLVVAGLVFLLGWQIKSSFQDPVRRRLEPRFTGGRFERHGELIDSLAAQIPQRQAATSEMAKELQLAGFYDPAAIKVFLSLRNGVMIAVVLATGLVAHYLGPERKDLVVRCLCGGVLLVGLCWSLPRLLIRARGRRRVGRISRSLPFALDMTVMCLSGGLTLREALSHVAHEIGAAHPDLAVELAIIRQHADMTSMEMAFRLFAERINNSEVAAMVALIIQNEQLGTDIAHSVRDYADAIRLKWRQLADERASKVGVYVLFPLSCLLLPAVLLILWGPPAVKLLDFFKDFGVPNLGEELDFEQ